MTKKQTVLVVEDEVFTARCICDDLMALGIDTLKPVATGEVAVEVAFKEKPDLILMDIRLAGALDGIDAAERILSKMSIPIIFITGFGIEYIQERIRKLSYIAILEKPAPINKIKELLDEIALGNLRPKLRE